MRYGEKKRRYRDAAVAERYERVRFGGLLGGVKAARDERLVLSILGAPVGDAVVLDLPCGTGRLLRPLALAGHRVVGADVSCEMMRAAEGAGSPRDLGRVQADAEQLPFADDAFDAVVSLRFLFHVDVPEVRVRVLREMARVARRLVVVQERDAATLRGRRRAREGGRRTGPDRHELAAELAEAGLRLMRAVPVARLFSDKSLFVAEPVRESRA